MNNDNKIKDLIIEMIKIPSYVDSKNDESKLTSFIEKIANNNNYEVITQTVEGNRKNLIVKGKGINPKVILFGHTDTVLPKSKNAFSPIEKGNKIYGLGSVDMKAGLAVMLAQLEKFTTDSGLCLILTVDEEYEFKGVKKLVSKYNYSPEYIINIEPTDLKIMQGCRGITEFSFETVGKTAHASRKNLGINAIEKTMEIYTELEMQIKKMNEKSVAKSSLNVAFLEGGIKKDEEITFAGNVVPNFAKTVGEIRIGHKEITEQYLRKFLNDTAKKLNVKIQNLKFKFYLGSMFTEKDKILEFERAVKKSGTKITYADINKTGFYEVQIPYEKWANSTTIIFGPGPSDKCHMEDEYVDMNTVYKTDEVINTFLNSVLKK